VFFVIALLVVAAIHGYLWWRLVRQPVRPGRLRRVAGVVVVVLGLLVPATLAGSRALPLAYARWLAWPGYLWLGLMFYLRVFLLLTEPARLVAWVVTRRRTRVDRQPAGVLAPTEPVPVAGGGPAGTTAVAEADPRPDDPDESDGPAHDPGRRLLIARAAAISAGLAATAVTGYGVHRALGPPDVLRVPMRLAKLPRRMDGFRIALVSDIHLGPMRGRAHTQRIVDTINRLDADLVAIVGDLVDGSVAELGSAAEPLRGLVSRRGSYFVTGNHEYYSGYRQWVHEVAALGVTPLRNDRVEVSGLDLAGVNDLGGRDVGDGPDFDRALSGRDLFRPVVLLAHQPVQVVESVRRGVDLQLSGHTHGGQFRPFDLVVRMEQPVVTGRAKYGDTQLYVTNGAGFWGPPVRVGAPPQISLVELHAP